MTFAVDKSCHSHDFCYGKLKLRKLNEKVVNYSYFCVLVIYCMTICRKESCFRQISCLTQGVLRLQGDPTKETVRSNLFLTGPKSGITQ